MIDYLMTGENIILNIMELTGPFSQEIISGLKWIILSWKSKSFMHISSFNLCLIIFSNCLIRLSLLLTTGIIYKNK